MKNELSYYYNLNPIKIYQNKKEYKFVVNNTEYYFVPYEYDINQLDKIFDLHKKLRNYNIYCHDIVLNNKMQISTQINNKQYVLLKIAKLKNEKIKFNDLIYYPLVTQNFFQDDFNITKKWRNLWMQRIDYFEYQVINFKKKYPLINKISSYYIGLGENAIQYLSNVKSNTKPCISHYRIKKNYTFYNMYNPLEFVIDSNVRDIAEFFKEKFFFDTININELYAILNQIIFNRDEAILFFSRLLYPTYFFDICVEMFFFDNGEKDLNIIISKHNEYELILIEVFSFLQTKYQIPNINWLKKR